uniref:PiggyBac transposable element-derived protein domain-containing protein n=1 Tax=Arion vulgaris TaxID=1028688 RepID=A0A0B7BCZ6_9EUPU
MAFNFLQNLFQDEDKFDSDDGEFFDDIAEIDNESDIGEELIQDLRQDIGDNTNTSISSYDDVLSMDGDNATPHHPTPQPCSSGDRVWSQQLDGINIEPFIEDTGPVNDIDIDSMYSPFDYLSLFLPETFFKDWADQTNAYADLKIFEKADPKRKPVSSDDTKIFLYVNYMFGIHQLPTYRMFWSKDELVNVPAVSNIISRNRFESISKYLHLSDNSKCIPRGQDGYDAIWKVRPLFDLILFRSRELLRPEQDISIDEAMVAFTGRLHFKQYIKNKPSPRGIKIWCAADPHSGYLHNFEVYTGKSTIQMKDGLGHHVVTTIGQPYLDKHHHFYFDNFFSSIKLAEDLSQNIEAKKI